MKLGIFGYICRLKVSILASGVVLLTGIYGIILHGCSAGSRTNKSFRTAGKFVAPRKGDKWGPDMVYVPGGATQMGGYEGGEIRNVTISSFYISKCVISNRNYLVYLDDLNRRGKYEEYNKALPDMSVWENDFMLNDSLKNYSSRRFLDYPVVGLKFKQMETYCTWLTDKETSLDFSEPIPIPNTKKSADLIVSSNTDQNLNNHTIDSTQTTNVVATDGMAVNSVLTNKEQETLQMASTSDLKKNEKAIPPIVPAPNQVDEEQLIKMRNEHSARLQKAIGEQMHAYRLPTEAEWEYAAKGGIIAQNEDGIETTIILDYGNIRSSVRFPDGIHKGELVGLFKRTHGLYRASAGIDAAEAPTEPVDTRVENGFGLQGCYGNVFEMTSDVFRLNDASQYGDYNPCRLDSKFDDVYDSSSPMSKKCRVVRGGSYKNSHYIQRVYAEEDVAYSDVGFRIVCSPA